MMMIDFFRKISVNIHSTHILFGLMLVLISCDNPHDSIDVIVRPKNIDVGIVEFEQIFKVKFKLKNCLNDTVTYYVLPDCDCTIVDKDKIILAPYGRTQFNAIITGDTPGKFVKYIFLQSNNQDLFITLTINGIVK